MAKWTITTGDFIVYKLNDDVNVNVDPKCPTQLIIIDNKTGKSNKIRNNTDVKIISRFDPKDKELNVGNVANILNISIKRVLKPLKEYAKRGFMKDISNETDLP